MELFPIEKITNNKCTFLAWKIHQKNVSSIYSSTNVRYICKIFKMSHDVLQMLIWKNINVFIKQLVFVG